MKMYLKKACALTIAGVIALIILTGCNSVVAPYIVEAVMSEITSEVSDAVGTEPQEESPPEPQREESASTPVQEQTPAPEASSQPSNTTRTHFPYKAQTLSEPKTLGQYEHLVCMIYSHSALVDEYGADISHLGVAPEGYVCVMFDGYDAGPDPYYDHYICFIFANESSVEITKDKVYISELGESYYVDFGTPVEA